MRRLGKISGFTAQLLERSAAPGNRYKAFFFYQTGKSSAFEKIIFPFPLPPLGRARQKPSVRDGGVEEYFGNACGSNS